MSNSRDKNNNSDDSYFSIEPFKEDNYDDNSAAAFQGDDATGAFDQHVKESGFRSDDEEAATREGRDIGQPPKKQLSPAEVSVTYKYEAGSCHHILLTCRSCGRSREQS